MELLDLIVVRPVLGDGAMGTMLLQRGLTAGECPEAWNLDRPDAVKAIHEAYREAGSDYLMTNTFGANPIKLAKYGLEHKLDRIAGRAVELAREAAGQACMVAASVGPTGGLLEPYGDYTAGQLSDCFRASAEAIDRAGVDFYLVETMSDVGEALLAVAAIREISDRPVCATMSFSKGAKDYRTMMGTSPEEAARKLVAGGASLVGTNCCNGISEAIDIIKTMRTASSLASVVQPNAGVPRMEDGRVVYPATPQEMAGRLEDLLAAGARVVGGCCGTTPDHIREMAAMMPKC